LESIKIMKDGRKEGWKENTGGKKRRKELRKKKAMTEGWIKASEQ